MISKKAQRIGMENLVYGIIVLLILGVVLFGLFYFDVHEKIIDLLSVGNDGEGEGFEDLEDIGDFEIKLESPERVTFWVKDGEGLFYACQNSVGWKYYNPEVEKWWNVDATSHYSFNDLKKVAKDFIISLDGLNCEEGLIVLVRRVRDERIGLNVYVDGDVVERYKYNNGDLEDYRFLIKKINMRVENE